MNVLAINPWIYDFAAYDFWLKPYGFLVILSYLKNAGVTIDYVDCLDKKKHPGLFGRSKYQSQKIPNPALFKKSGRQFKRYGISLEEFARTLDNKNPDFILMTSSMTYWYPGVIEAANILRRRFPATPIFLGGTYATLCHEHAKKNIPCDQVFKNDSLKDFFSRLGQKFDAQKFFATLPDYGYFYPDAGYAVLRTSWGCPFKCSYCAIGALSQKFRRIPAKNVLAFIFRCARQGIKDFALYDDAFLYQPQYAKDLLSKIAAAKQNLRFHTPNALHLRFVDDRLCRLLRDAGFIDPHFGLETLNPALQKVWSEKATVQDLERTSRLMRQAGFKPGEFSVYLLLGYPGQNLAELKKDADYLHSLGVKISLAEFSPVPGTKIFDEHKENFSEPLLQNNSVFAGFLPEQAQEIREIKNYVNKLNKTFFSRALTDPANTPQT